MDTDLERRAARIFEQTLDAPTGDRPAAIDAACGGDAALLARVRALAAADRSDGFLSNPTVDAGPRTPPTNASAAELAERPGTVVGGRYKLLQQIGEGGFGVVFLAEQQVPVRRQVALKVIKLGMDTREVVARFEAERQALALMDHPNIAKVLDAGSTDAGRPYFVMELVRGLPVTDYADKHRLSPADRVALLAQVCRAVQHAHGKGVIHRDLKPSNVLVTTGDGDQPVPKVIDFGIAKATQSRLTDRTLFTQFRQLIGTPQYMSPEQADSEGLDVDTRSDVYSLGVLLYELLVGVTPLDARALRSAAFEAMRRMIRDDEVPRPSTRLHTMAAGTVTALATNRSTDAKHLAVVVRGELDWIVMRALEKDRSRRYDTAAALADDLGRYLAGEAVLAGPVSGAYRLRKLARRYRAAVAVGGALAACLLLGVVGTTYGLVRAQANERRALAGEEEARREKAAADASAAAAERQKGVATANERRAIDKQAEATATLNFLTGLLAKASPNDAKDDRVSDVLVNALIKPALATIDERFEGQPLVRAAVQNTLAGTLVDLGRSDLALPQAKAAWDTFRNKLGDDHPDTLWAMRDYGYALDALGRHAEAADVSKEEWDRSRRVQGDDHPDTLEAMNSYGDALFGLGRYAEAADVLKQAWDRRRRVLGDDQPDTIQVMTNYGSALNGLGRWTEAAEVYKQAWDRSRRVLGEDDPKTLAAMNNYGTALFSLTRYEDAADVDKQVWDRSQRVLGVDHPGTLAAMGNYGNALDCLGRHAEAADVLKQAWGRRKRVQGDDHPDTVKSLENYALCLKAQGRSPEAEPLLKRVWGARRRVKGDDDPATLSGLNNYASALADQGRDAEAEQLFKQVWDTRRRVQGADHPDTVDAMSNYGTVLASLNRRIEAAEVFKQAWDRDRRVRGDDHPGTIKALNKYGEALNNLGRYTEAADLCKPAWDRDRRVLGDDHPDTIDAMNNYGRALNKLGRLADLVEVYKQAWDRHRRMLGDDHLETIGAMNIYGFALAGQGRHAEAEPVLRQTADTLRRVLPDAPIRGDVLRFLCQCLAAQHKLAAAEDVARENLEWDRAHSAADRRPGDVPGSVTLLNQVLKAEGKPLELTSVATTRPS